LDRRIVSDAAEYQPEVRCRLQLIQVAAASTTIPVTNAAMQEYSKISLRTLTIVLSTRGLLTRRGFRALEIHWTAKCYELANKEAATWDENGAVTICRASAAPPHPPHPRRSLLDRKS